MGGTGTGRSGNSRLAKLVELVNSDFSPMYKFSHDSTDFKKDSPTDEGSDLVYMTFKENPGFDSDDIKQEAMKTFERDYKDILDFEDSIERQKEKRSYYEERLDFLKAKNFYNPLPLKEKAKNALTFLELYSAGLIGAGIYDEFVQSIPVGSTFGGLGLILGGSIEGIRRIGKAANKDYINRIDKNIEFYDNFKRNIENSRVEIISSPEAQKVYNKVKNSNTPGYLNFEQANRDLKQAYGVY